MRKIARWLPTFSSLLCCQLSRSTYLTALRVAPGEGTIIPIIQTGCGGGGFAGLGLGLGAGLGLGSGLGLGAGLGLGFVAALIVVVLTAKKGASRKFR